MEQQFNDMIDEEGYLKPNDKQHFESSKEIAP